MAIELGYWSSLYTSPTGELGGVCSFAVDGILGNGLEYEDITAPGQGEGKLYVYSKHYVAITGYDGLSGYNNLSVCLLNKTSPEGVTLAPTAGELHSIANGSHHLSTLGEVGWRNGAEPQFATANGWSNAITISTGDMTVIGFTGTGAAPTGEEPASSGEFILPPEEPSITTPLEVDCDILINCQNFEIQFVGDSVTGVADILQSNDWAGLGFGGWTTGDLAERSTGDGNWVGSLNGEINLLSQALNMCCDQKEYGAVVANHSDPVGPLSIGIISGNAGTVAFSHGNKANSWPATRISENTREAWDNSSNSGPPVEPITGDYGTYGWDLKIVGLTTGCEANLGNIGPTAGNEFPSGTAERTKTIEVHKIGLRVGATLGSGTNYIGLHNGFQAKFVLVGIDWLPCDPTKDGWALKSSTFNGKPILWDAQTAVLQAEDASDLGPLAYFSGNGTSRNYPTNTYSDKVSFLEHNYYLRGGTGDVWYVDHGRGDLEITESNRTFSQIRPYALSLSDLPRSGNVVWKNNFITGYSMNNVNSEDEIAGAAAGGGGVMTVWNNHGDTWFIDNEVTDAYMQALVCVRQASLPSDDRVLPDADGWDLNRVFLTGNTLSNYPDAVGTNRGTVTLSDMRELHIMPGNSIFPGTQSTAFINNIPASTSEALGNWGDTIDYKVIGTIYEYPDTDMTVDFSGDIKTWKQNDGVFVTLNKENPVEDIAEWVKIGAFGVGFDPGDTASFWLRREFSENYTATGESSLLFGFSADPIG